MPDRLGDDAAHHAGDGRQRVEPRPDQLLHDEGRAATLFTQDACRQVVVLDLRGGKTAPAELVLQPLQAEPGMWPLGDEAGDPRIGLREREEDLEHGVGAEPLVTRQLEPAVADRLGDRGVGPQIGAALLLGHDHPRLGEGVVVGQRQPWLPFLGQRLVLTHGRDGRVVDRHRAARARVELIEEVEQARSHDVGACPWLAPRQRVDLALDTQAQHPVHRRVVLDLIDAVAVAVVRLQHGDVALRAPGMIERLCRGDGRAEIADTLETPLAALADQRLAQRRVGFERVVADERRWLVEHLVRGCTIGAARGRHHRLPRRTLRSCDHSAPGSQPRSSYRLQNARSPGCAGLPDINPCRPPYPSGGSGLGSCGRCGERVSRKQQDPTAKTLAKCGLRGVRLVRL